MGSRSLFSDIRRTRFADLGDENLSEAYDDSD